MALSPQWLDELRHRTTLSALIGKSVQVKRHGREFQACCPFHNEKTPSFTINDEKGFYHCFGCGAHGDAIRWMTDHKGLQFMDAVKDLAAAAGMEVPAQTPAQRERNDARLRLIDLTGAAASWYQQQLATDPAREAREYLSKRGITPDIVKRFGIGFAPDARDSMRKALSGAPIEAIVETGLMIAVDDKEPYDRFRGRIMIPIKDPRGRVISFGGRAMGDAQPKYLNGPDSPLFDKGRTIYNMDMASAASRKSGKLLVVEGYMDVIACAAFAGIEETVAPLGTAMTEDQFILAWRMVDTPVLCFDGDSAGQKAAMRAAERVLPGLEPGKSIAFAHMPSGADPDDVIRKQGRDAFLAMVNKPMSLIDKLWTHTIESMPAETPEEKAAIKRRLYDISDQIGHTDIREGYAAEFRERYQAHFYPPRERTEQKPGERRQWTGQRRQPERKPDISGTASAMEEILSRSIAALCIRFPPLALRHSEDVVGISATPDVREVLMRATDIAIDTGGKVEPGPFMFDDHELRATAREIVDDKANLLSAADFATAEKAITLLIDFYFIERALDDAKARVEEMADDGALSAFQDITAQRATIMSGLANMNTLLSGRAQDVGQKR